MLSFRWVCHSKIGPGRGPSLSRGGPILVWPKLPPPRTYFGPDQIFIDSVANEGGGVNVCLF